MITWMKEAPKNKKKGWREERKDENKDRKDRNLRMEKQERPKIELEDATLEPELLENHAEQARYKAWLLHKDVREEGGEPIEEEYEEAKKSFFMASVHHVNYDHELVADTFKVSDYPRSELLDVCPITGDRLYWQRREILLDSGASSHLFCKGDLNPEELKTMRKLKRPRKLQTANGEAIVTHCVEIYITVLKITITANILENTSNVLSMGLLCSQLGYHCHWGLNRLPYLKKGSFKVYCNVNNNVPYVGQGTIYIVRQKQITKMPQEIKDEPQVKITEKDEDEESETIVSATVSEDDQNGAGSFKSATSDEEVRKIENYNEPQIERVIKHDFANKTNIHQIDERSQKRVTKDATKIWKHDEDNREKSETYGTAPAEYMSTAPAGDSNMTLPEALYCDLNKTQDSETQMNVSNDCNDKNEEEQKHTPEENDEVTKSEIRGEQANNDRQLMIKDEENQDPDM